MRIKAIFFTLVLSLLAIVGIATASPNFQTTPYSTNNFSATFNGPVTADPMQRSTDGQSSNYAYYSFNETTGVGQIVIVRFVDHDISVDYTSSDFYANDDTTGGVITNRSTTTYQGHPLTYTRHGYTEDGVQLSKRTRFIIVNSREVIFLEQIAPFVDYDQFPTLDGDKPQWVEFEDSLNIK